MFVRLTTIMLLIVPLLLTACNQGISIERNPAGGVDISATLNEADVNTVVTNALNASTDPVLHNVSVDLQPGRIVVNGEYDRQNGSGRASGSLTISVSAQNGALQVQVTDINAGGLTLTDSRLTTFNQQLQQRLTQRASNNPNITVQSVNITDSNLNITINAQSSE